LPLYAQESELPQLPQPEPTMSGSLTQALGLLNDTETVLERQQRQIDDLLNEMSESKVDFQKLEVLQKNLSQTFEEQSKLLAQSETRSKRWKMTTLIGIPVGIVLGLVLGMVIR
jgi:tetrahydromethanopterin S-methyltransferase subunit G